ncbi:TetR/AcrR family transcriptional regulator [Hyphomicrobium sulfonivorans]|uniref:TetR/AcrR family transcriptional regulator n=1 Tax=Hyphomicrobium sulfonivorans TaxID=121290 RepID=UPI001570FFFC|nr:TetR/AcrR family transcriptional regulator [Hyphomicrobium sulfonivorans]MBI1649402.1 TetR/AcrR family transcriptional regulator [Hyphomicrobium sulfonivorans]NSL71319.1 TetR/AcrR family transcriptional regulator [Hyphomicrobium sulfonivorans]
MPKLKPATQAARREHILDAAELCFARSGFHRTTMQDICREAAISPGALYVYFSSKEDLIAGLVERDRAEFAQRFAAVADGHDFIGALSELGNHYFNEEPVHRRTLCLEIALESTRNERVGEIYRAVDREVSQSFETLFAKLADEGRIAPDLDIPTVAKVFSLIGDGLFTRRVVEPELDMEPIIAGALNLVGKLLNVVPPDQVQALSKNAPSDVAAPSSQPSKPAKAKRT